MPNVIFTTILNGYDTLKDPTVVTPGWDYLCQSDTGLGSAVWKPVDVSGCPPGIVSPKRRASLLKIEHYRHVRSDYDVCMTLDGSMRLCTDLDAFMADHWDGSVDLMLAKHPLRDCIYDEATVVLSEQVDDPDTVTDHMKRYVDEDFPRHAGLYSARMMVKNNRSPRLRRVCEIWAEEYRRGSRRDQLSLNYAIWKAHREGVHLRVRELDFNQLYIDSGKFRIEPHLGSRQWL